MPTKRRARSRYPRVELTLSPTIREVLLCGWSAPVPPDGAGDDQFAIFELSVDDLAALWRANRLKLKDIWLRRGETGPTFAERCFEGAVCGE